MPRSTREWAQRKLEEAIGNIEWAKQHLAEVGEKYDEQHPEVSGPILVTLETLLKVVEFIGKIRESF